MLLEQGTEIIEISVERNAKLEELLAALRRWQKSPSAVMWQPVGKLVRELTTPQQPPSRD